MAGRAGSASAALRTHAAQALHEVVRRVGLQAGAALIVIGVVALAATLRPASDFGALGSPLVWLGWLLGVALLILAAAEGLELVDLAVPKQGADDEPRRCTGPRPFVSLHVPICSEPPELVIRTLLALQALDYDRFEVVVIDNNTAVEALWRPIERLCQTLGPRFRFYHLPRWPGYKAGALNFALAHTAPEAAIIGVIDADYEVASDFLARLTGHFSDPDVGFVQAPQDYREWDERWLTRMFYWEYWQFFAVSMRLRRARNAILMHGTMVMVRKAALLRVGGWAEWCLTEDSELGLRLLAAGYRGVYCAKTHGRGLVPFSSRAYRRQRERWVTGAVQIVRRHWPLFLPWSGALTIAQKAHYLQGWAPWLRDGIIVACAPLIALLGGFSLACAATPAPLHPLTSALLAVCAYLAIRQIIVYRLYLLRPWADGIGAGVAIFALVATVGRAWLRGWLGFHLAFERTPKQRQADGETRGRKSAELFWGATTILLALGMLVRFGRNGIWAAGGLCAYGALFLTSVYVEHVDQRGG